MGMLPDTMKAGGMVYTPYSCMAFDVEADGTVATDIEHIVALADEGDGGRCERSSIPWEWEHLRQRRNGDRLPHRHREHEDAVAAELPRPCDGGPTRSVGSVYMQAYRLGLHGQPRSDDHDESSAIRRRVLATDEAGVVRVDCRHRQRLQSRHRRRDRPGASPTPGLHLIPTQDRGSVRRFGDGVFCVSSCLSRLAAPARVGAWPASTSLHHPAFDLGGLVPDPAGVGRDGDMPAFHGRHRVRIGLDGRRPLRRTAVIGAPS